MIHEAVVIGTKQPLVMIRNSDTNRVLYVPLKFNSCEKEYNRLRGHIGCVLKKGTTCRYTEDDKGLIDIAFDVPDPPDVAEISTIYQVLPDGHKAFARRQCGCTTYLSSLARVENRDHEWIIGSVVSHRISLLRSRLQASEIRIISVPAIEENHRAKPDISIGTKVLSGENKGGVHVYGKRRQ